MKISFKYNNDTYFYQNVFRIILLGDETISVEFNIGKEGLILNPGENLYEKFYEEFELWNC